MPKTLVIVESPTKARTISKFLGSAYIVRASMGHIRDLPQKNLGVDIENNYEPDYVVSREKNKTVKELKADLAKADKILLATDEDREGEAIAWHLVHALKIKNKPFQRIVFHEITKDAIKNAIKNPRDINISLVDAQQARRILDRLVGYKLSPFLWKKVRKGLSAGRVQSVAVRLIVDKEREIQAFVQEEYWHMQAIVQTPRKDVLTAQLEKVGKSKMPVKTEKDILDLRKKIEKIEDFEVVDVTKKDKKRTPPAPFTTSTLQQEASRKFGYGVKNTMRIAQQLYEGVDVGQGAQGLITYMRTDSVSLSKTALDQAKKVVDSVFGKEFSLKSPRTYKTKAKGAQEAHEAIRPSDLSLLPSEAKQYLTKEQFNLYSLIWNRTVATQMQDAKLEQTSVRLSPKGMEDFVFAAHGTVVKFPGFMKLYIEGKDTEEEEQGILPQIDKGEICLRKDLNQTQHFTKPPARYTEASLVKKLESEGIGRPSTYAPTISTIIEKGYIEKDKKHLLPTDIAFVVTDLLVEHFKKEIDYGFTASIEEQFDEIAEGKEKWQKVIDAFYKEFAANLEKKTTEVQKIQEKTGKMCPDCGHEMVIKFGRFGKFIACSNYPECKHIEAMAEEEARKKELEEKYKDKKCETCGSSLMVKRGRFGEFLACSKYPDCKFTAPIVEGTGVPCNECGKGEFVERKSKRGRIFYSCNKYPDCKNAVWNKPVPEKCPECKGLMTWQKKGVVGCTSCGHKEEREEE